MSFQHKSFWMLRDGGCLTDGEMGYNNSSRIQPKRSPQWFMDSAGPELFNNKRQAIEAVGSRPISDMTVSSWPNVSSFQSVSGQFPDHSFRSGPLQTFNLGDGNTPIGSGNMNVGRKDFEHQYDSGSSVSLSMSHTTEDASPCLSFGVRKVKVNQVRDSSSGMAAPMEHSMGTAYDRSDNSISLGPTYGNVDENIISMGPAFSKADGNFISMGHSFNKGDGSFISMGHNYNKGNENILSMGQSLDRGNGSFISIGQSYEKGDSNLISLSSSYGNGNDNFISMAPSYNKHESVVSMAPSCEKGVGNLISIGQSYDKADFNVTAVGPAQDEGDSSILSVGHNYNKDECHAISFGTLHDEPEANRPGSIISSYDLLMNNHNPVQVPDVAGQKELVEATPDSNVNSAPKSNSKMDTKPKTKEPKTAKRVPPNNFPSNVKSLLSTGILDGVQVKYVSWSREKSLKGYIKGTGYSCGCTECKFEKALNAYEFERHANCKTKHPNNHIYFENGKTIYAVVQELKNTPQEMLFDTIQNVTGSRINEKNFRVWKASYQAATRELQRIYGKDEVPQPS